MEKNMNSAVCLLDRAAEKYGDKTAFEDADTSISFNELKEKARAVGSGLLKRVKTGGAHPIVVYLPKSVNSVIGFIGAMYAGSPYAPVNYDAPLVRLEKIVSTLVPSAIITDDEGKKRLEALETEADILLPEDLMSEPADDAVVDEAIEKVCASDPAYIMFTSGTTGIPKGVTVSGESLINLVRWCTDTFEFDENDIWGLAAPFHFDSTITDIYSSIYKGSAVCIIPEALLMYPDRLMEYVAEKKISCIHWVPTIIKRVANSGVLEKLKLPDLKLVLSGAEIMPNKQLNIWRKNLPQCIYANLYGPTEATVESAYYIVDREFHDDDRLPIGKACKNTRILILNEDDKPCKTGEKGELCIGGTGVALGYWNEPELTKSVFVQ
ncbi:MAG: AMP-binding protein, partial [Oscillospiraceae bacterium]|nr:AMP-binding protein [Oscillospiraceae bacterium]